MNSKQGTFWKFVFMIEIPILLIAYVLSAIWLYFLKSFISEAGKLAALQNSMLLVWGLGLLLITGFVIIIAKVISSKVSKISDAVEQLMIAGPETASESDARQSKDQLDEIRFSLEQAAKNIKIRSIEAESLALYDTSIVIEPNAEGDLLGESLLRIQNAIKQFEADAATITDQTERDVGDKSGSIAEEFKKLVMITTRH